MEITMLGTGNALATECYNTCFILREKKRYFLTDGGGGSTIIRQIKHAGYDWREVKDLFVTHRHADHLLGMVWMVRMITQAMCSGTYPGEARIYGHEEVISILREISQLILTEKEVSCFGRRLFLIAVKDGESRQICGQKTTFFDIRSSKVRQFGFRMELPDGQGLICCGDEPFHPSEEPYARNCSWMLHEAFCLHADADRFHPYEKHHSTVRDACETAERLGVKNLVLYHTEDTCLSTRRARYLEEGRACYSGRLFVPDDLETIDLSAEESSGE